MFSPPLTVNFVTPDDGTITVQCHEGQSILDIAHEHEVELEGTFLFFCAIQLCLDTICLETHLTVSTKGACEGSLACSTCHVVVQPEYYSKLHEPSDEENDMLDLAFGLTDTSRLGCQVIMTKELNNITVTIPSATRNMAVDGTDLYNNIT
jgi:ferredoxin